MSLIAEQQQHDMCAGKMTSTIRSSDPHILILLQRTGVVGILPEPADVAGR